MRALFALLPLSVLAVACATAVADAPPPTASYATVEGYCSARAAAECNATVVSHCGVKDASSCTSKRAAACVGAAPQGATYVAAKAGPCVDAVTAAYATATLTRESLDKVDQACALVFSGPGAVRAPCATDIDCSSADGLSCVVPTGQKAGKCLKPNAVMGGAACGGEADVCPSDYFCDAKSTTCVAKGAVGSDCIPDQMPCMQGLKCNYSLFNTGCVALAPAGSPCMLDSECADGLCDKAMSSATGTCSAAITLSPLDAKCVDYK